MTLEESFEQLQLLIEELENPELTLEDSFTKYEQGMKLLKSCHDQIETIEQKVMEMNKEGELHEF